MEHAARVVPSCYPGAICTNKPTPVGAEVITKLVNGSPDSIAPWRDAWCLDRRTRLETSKEALRGPVMPGYSCLASELVPIHHQPLHETV
jgi:hypothetical protein